MKKIYAILSIFCAASFLSSAEVVDSQTALNVAKEFFGSKSMTMVWSGDQTKSASMADPAYYTFNNPDGGWVMIAGDDCSEPVLAYSMTGSFNPDNLPVNFVKWMNGISRNISAVRKAKMTPKTAIKNKWKSVGMTKATSENLIETALWGQDSPFNNYCPTNCPTGCVATAMSIVMRQNAFNVVGKGKIPAYTTTTDSKSVKAIDITGYEYKWSDMPLEYTSKATDAQKEAVARLMQHCGAMVQMDYTSDGSGAFSCDIVPAMAEYFGYSQSAYEVYRNGFSNYDWLAVIRKEIDANRALIYGGADSETEDGHQFVLDGYNSDNKVHINWGWEGVCNGWYAICYLGDKSSSGVNDVFSYFDSAIIGLTFDSAGTDGTNVDISMEAYEEDGFYGISLASGTIAKGSTFKLDLGYICNYDAYNTYNGAVKVGLFNKNGELKEYVGNEFSVTLDPCDSQGYPGETTKSDYSCIITQDIVLGDYLQAVYKMADGSWRPMAAYRSDEFTSEEYHTVGKLGVLDIAYLVVPTNPKAGELVYFDMVGSHKLPTAIKWYWDNSQITNGYVSPKSGTHTLKAVITYSDNSTETLQKVIKVQ